MLRNGNMPTDRAAAVQLRCPSATWAPQWPEKYNPPSTPATKPKKIQPAAMLEAFATSADKAAAPMKGANSIRVPTGCANTW